MYMWLAVPRARAESSEAFAERLLEHGVLVTPGSYLGAAGEGYVRLALVPSEDDCRRAIEILEERAVNPAARRGDRRGTRQW